MAINGRFQQKFDYEANWLKATNFVPLKGEVIVYLAEANPNGTLISGATLPSGRTTPYSYPRTKIGDGTSTVTSLPFSTSMVQICTWESDD